MLTFLPPNILPSTERLSNGTISNRDGHGWAIVVLGDDGKGSHIVTGYSMNADAAIEAFRLTREKHPEGPALFHSRMTTGGLIDETNCHPYVVNNDPRTVLAHNGILPDMGMMLKDERSDTRFFCDEYGWMLYPGSEPKDAKTGKPIPNFSLNSKRGRRRLSRWLGRPNKYVILTVDPTFRRNHFIINADQGIWEDDGCWYSNSGYLDKPFTYGIRSRKFIGGGWTGWDDDDNYYASYASPGKKKWWEDAAEGKGSDVWTRLASMTDQAVMIDKSPDPDIDPDTSCPICGAKGTIHPLHWCTACGVCVDCFGDALDDYASDVPCSCAWPMGEHPGHRKAVEERFAASAVDVNPGEATTTVLGYPPAQKALPAGATVREPEQSALGGEV